MANDTRIVEVNIRLYLNPTVDADEVIQEMDWEFAHPGIREQRLIDCVMDVGV